MSIGTAAATPLDRDSVREAAVQQPAPRRAIPAWVVRCLLAVPLPVAFVVLWHVGVQQQWTLPLGIRMALLPLPTEVARTMADFTVGGLNDDAFSGQLWVHLWASVQRVAFGFGLAAVVAVPLGILMGRLPILNALVDPLVQLIRPIPATAWLPLVIIVIGVGDQATVFLIALVSFFPILMGSISGAREAPQRLVEAAAMLGARRGVILTKIVLPAAAPAVVNGLRLGLGLAWVVLVLGETAGASTGLGATISLARDISRTDLIIAGMALVGCAGFLSDRLLLTSFRILTRGRPLVK